MKDKIVVIDNDKKAKKNKRMTTDLASILGSSLATPGREATSVVYKILDKIEKQEQEIEKLQKQISFLTSKSKIPFQFNFKYIGEKELTFPTKFAFVNTGIEGWDKKKLIYLSFGKRVASGSSIGGGEFVVVEKLLNIPWSEEGANAGSDKGPSISLGNKCLQATYINTQVNIGRTPDNVLLVASANINSGSFPLTVYEVLLEQI